MKNPVIRNSAYCLVHVPDLVRYGSKPRREIADDPVFEERLGAALRPFEAAVAYPPNQTFIGNLEPAGLAAIERPWFYSRHAGQDGTTNTGPFGEIISQELFYAALKQADVLEPALVEMSKETLAADAKLLAGHPAFAVFDRSFPQPPPASAIEAEVKRGEAIAFLEQGILRGHMRGDARAEGRNDPNLDALTLLEALATKTSGALALRLLLRRENLAAQTIDYIISCGEEAAGDRYQRGGGGMAKAIGEMCGCVNASGMDVKNFCAAPASALVTAAAMVKAGLYETVVVVAGGSLAKLGMKSVAFLDRELPVLDDCLGAMAFLVTCNDGESPVLRLEPGAVGRARIGSSTSDKAIYRDLILAPLQALGLGMGDIDKFAPELHNPEIMEHSGSGDVVHKNYRMIAATAVMAGVIDKADMDAFIERVGLPGYAPTQGHIPSGVPYVGHAAAAMRRGEITRAMFLCKASLFLNRLTGLYDGVSFVLETPQ